MGKFSKIHCAKSPFHQKEQFPTRPLNPGEGKPNTGGIHSTMINVVKNIGKKIFKK